MKLSYFLLWMPMIVIAILNGSFRQFVMLPRMPETLAHQVSTLMLMVLCGVYVWLIFPRLGISSSGQALMLGLVWALLTIAFEFSMGLLAHKSWSVMLHDYDLSAGRIWPVFLMWLAALPLLTHLARKS